MAVKIRLKRLGAKKKPFYRLVVADSRSPRNGKFIEEIGYYNPVSEPKQFKVDSDKVKTWMSNGAKPTDTVMGLFKKYEVLTAEGVVASGLPEVKKPAKKAAKKVEEVKEEKTVEEKAAAVEPVEVADQGEYVAPATEENVEAAVKESESAFVEEQKVENNAAEEVAEETEA